MIDSIDAGIRLVDYTAGYIWAIYIGFMLYIVILLAGANMLLRASGMILLIFMTATYPMYTGHYQLLPGLIGNFVHLCLTSALFLWIRPVLPRPSLLLLPIIVWVSLASVSAMSSLFI